MGLLSPKSRGSFGKQSCRSCIRGFGGIWLQAIPEFHWDSLGSISVPFLSLAASNCCVKKGAVPPCLAMPCIPAHTAAGRAEIHGASPRSGKEELKGLENLRGSAQELPALLHPPGIPQPRLAPPTRQLLSLGLGEFPWESSPRERSCSQGSLWRAGNGPRLSLFAGIQVWNTRSGDRGMSPQFPHGWDQILLGMSQLPTLQPCPRSKRMRRVLKPLEYPIPLGRASGDSGTCWEL